MYKWGDLDDGCIYSLSIVVSLDIPKASTLKCIEHSNSKDIKKEILKLLNSLGSDFWIVLLSARQFPVYCLATTEQQQPPFTHPSLIVLYRSNTSGRVPISDAYI